jgi:hypothetical protein
MASGAPAGDVQRLGFKQSFLPVGVGLGAGLVASSLSLSVLSSRHSTTRPLHGQQTCLSRPRGARAGHARHGLGSGDVNQGRPNPRFQRSALGVTELPSATGEIASRPRLIRIPFFMRQAPQNTPVTDRPLIQLWSLESHNGPAL